MGISCVVVCSCFRPTVLSYAKTVLLMKSKTIISLAFMMLLAFCLVPELQAQCPMCKIAADSNLRDGGTAGHGLNTGILYMFAMPYLLVFTLGYIWYRNRKEYDKSE